MIVGTTLAYQSDMTNINRPSSSSPGSTSTASTASTAKPSTTPPPDTDGDVESLPQTATSTPPRRASAEEIAAARSAVASVKDDASAEDAALALIRLPNADFAAAIKDVAATPGQLENLLAHVPESTKDTIQRRLVRSGVLQPAVTQPPTPTPPKAPAPPNAPVVLKDDPSLPPALRQLAVDENIAKLQPWKQQMADYRSAYGSAVDNAKSIDELRALGPMAPPTAPEHMPSTTGAVGGPYNSAYEAARTRNVSDDKMMTRVADKAREHTGQPVAGLSFKAGASAMVTLSGVSGFGLDVEASRSASGKTETGATVRAGAGPVEIAVDDQGKVEGTVTLGPVEMVAGAKRGAIVVEVGGTGVGAGFSEEAGLEFEASLGGLGGSASYNGDGMAYGIKGERKLALGDSEVKLGFEAELGLQGVTKADRDAFVSTSQIDFFTQPSGALLAIPWSTLPADVRDAFKHQMWSEATWSAAGKRDGDLKLRR